MKKFIGYGLVAVLTAAVLGTTALIAKPNMTQFVRADNVYECASVHFGMNDNDYKAMTYDCSNGTVDLAGYYTATEGLISSIECSTYEEKGKTKNTVFHGGSYNGPVGYSQYAIRVGASKKIGTITLTLNSSIIGCTVYALPYIGKSGDNDIHEPVTMVVNGQEVDLSEVYGPTSKNKVAATAEIYEPYFFSFAATDTLIITAKQASKTIDGSSKSACRFYLADISFRVAV